MPKRFVPVTSSLPHLLSAYLMRHDRCAKPACSPRHEQLRRKGCPDSSGPSSKQIQHDAASPVTMVSSATFDLIGVNVDLSVFVVWCYGSSQGRHSLLPQEAGGGGHNIRRAHHRVLPAKEPLYGTSSHVPYVLDLFESTRVSAAPHMTVL